VLLCGNSVSRRYAIRRFHAVDWVRLIDRVTLIRRDSPPPRIPLVCICEPTSVCRPQKNPRSCDVPHGVSKRNRTRRFKQTRPSTECRGERDISSRPESHVREPVPRHRLRGKTHERAAIPSRRASTEPKIPVTPRSSTSSTNPFASPFAAAANQLDETDQDETR